MTCLPCHPDCGECGSCGCFCPVNKEKGVFTPPPLDYHIYSGSSSVIPANFKFISPFDWGKEAHDLKVKLRESEERRMEQARQIMALMADLSSSRTEQARLQELITQHWRDNEGHNHCWRNNHRLWEGAGLRQKQLKLPPRDEAEEGCRAFWDELYSNPDRWPDFVQISDSPRADGICRTCAGPVPSTNLNLFYCCEKCRIIGWEKHHPGQKWDPDGTE